LLTDASPSGLTAWFGSADAIRSRSVSTIVAVGHTHIDPLPARLVADCEHEIRVHLALAPGDVEPLSLVRARARWPQYRRCVNAMSDWMGTLGLRDVLQDSGVDLMACRGARYHHDAVQYGGKAFCNLFLGEDRGLDLHFPGTGQRIALTRGCAVIFDTAQPHAVVPRGASSFDAADFPPGRDCTLLFLTWELPIEDARVAQALGIAFETSRPIPAPADEGHIELNGVRAELCPHTGRWLLA
jgi:hypothetical protein